MTHKTISVIGLGYIGLPTAAIIASEKHHVIGIDINNHIVETINSGMVHIKEPYLETLVKKAVTKGFFEAKTLPVVSDVFIVAVPTPLKYTQSDIPEPDLTYVKSAADSISHVLKKGDLVIIESTSPVGTTEEITHLLSQKRKDLSFPLDSNKDSDVYVAYCPERVLPGQILKELVVNDRVIGGMSPRSSELASKFYKNFIKGNCIVTNSRTAEMVKLTENSCRDVQIAFANELSMICDQLDVNVWELIDLANRHPRINILQPGPGVGGHCIAVDPWFIVSKTPQEAKIVHLARNINNAKAEWVVNKIKALISSFLQENSKKSIKDVTIACYGLTFKPDIDDIRESPSLEITRKVANFHLGKVLAVEPNLAQLPSTTSEFDLTDFETAKEIADIHVLLVDHTEFKKNVIMSKYLLDTKGIW